MRKVNIVSTNVFTSWIPTLVKRIIVVRLGGENTSTSKATTASFGNVYDHAPSNFIIIPRRLACRAWRSVNRYMCIPNPEETLTETSIALARQTSLGR